VLGNSTSTVWMTRELYGQYPVGLNIRMSLDLNLQEQADALMQGKTGGLVVLNAKTGEVLAISNSPTFDANKLDESWQTWIADSTAPLLNRVTLGQYPIGSAPGAFLLARYLSNHELPALIPTYDWSAGVGESNSCAVTPGKDPSWPELISSGCSEAISTLMQNYTPEELIAFYNELGFTSKATTQVESSDAWTFSAVNSISDFFTSDSIRISPLQMAIAAAELTNGGKKVTPSFVLAFQSPEGDWRLLPTNSNIGTVADFSAEAAADSLVLGESPIWQVLAQVKDQEKTVSWFVAGTPSDWQGIPLAIVVVLEDAAPAQAETIGQTLIDNLFSQ